MIRALTFVLCLAPILTNCARPDSIQDRKGNVGGYQRAIYTAKVNGVAAADLQLDSTHTLDPIDVLGANQCKLGFAFTQASMSAIRFTFESSNTQYGTYYPIGEYTKSSATLTGAQRVYDWTTGSSGQGELMVPVMRRYLRPTVTGVSGTTSDELDSAEFTCGEF